MTSKACEMCKRRINNTCCDCWKNLPKYKITSLTNVKKEIHREYAEVDEHKNTLMYLDEDFNTGIYTDTTSC